MASFEGSHRHANPRTICLRACMRQYCWAHLLFPWPSNLLRRKVGCRRQAFCRWDMMSASPFSPGPHGVFLAHLQIHITSDAKAWYSDSGSFLLLGSLKRPATPRSQDPSTPLLQTMDDTVCGPERLDISLIGRARSYHCPVTSQKYHQIARLKPERGHTIEPPLFVRGPGGRPSGIRSKTSGGMFALCLDNRSIAEASQQQSLGHY